MSKNQLDKPFLTAKQENFARCLFQGYTQRQAWINAGYSHNFSVALIDTHSCNLANSDKVLIRLQQLRNEAASKEIADYHERQSIASKIARSTMADFTDEAGNVQLTPDNLKNPALAGVKVSEFTGGPEGRASEKTVNVKVRDPLAAIDLLNKMDGLYRPELRIDNSKKTINIIVPDGETKALIEGLANPRKGLIEQGKGDEG